MFKAENENLIDFEYISGDGIKIKSIVSRNNIYNEKLAKQRLSHIEKSVNEISQKMTKSHDKTEIDELNKHLDKKNNLRITLRQVYI